MKGFVYDASTNHPLANAKVVVFSGAGIHHMLSGNDGHYKFDLPPDTYTIFCTIPGYKIQDYKSVRLEPNTTVILNFNLPKVSVQENTNELLIPSALGGNSAKNEDFSSPQMTGLNTQKQSTTESAQASKPTHDTQQYQLGEPERFNKDFLFAFGTGYAVGKLGGLSAQMDLSLSRMLGRADASSTFYLGLRLAGEQKHYKSKMFADADKDYHFGFTRTAAALGHVFSIKRLLIVPELELGREWARTHHRNLHPMVDSTYLIGHYLAPSLSFGLAITPHLSIHLAGYYYYMLDEISNNQNQAFATKHPDTGEWVPLSYTNDFFENRKGLSVMLGLKVYL